MSEAKRQLANIEPIKVSEFNTCKETTYQQVKDRLNDVKRFVRIFVSSIVGRWYIVSLHVLNLFMCIGAIFVHCLSSTSSTAKVGAVRD